MKNCKKMLDDYDKLYKKKKESWLPFWRFIRNIENKTELRTGTDKCRKFCIQCGYSMGNIDCIFFFSCLSGVVVFVSLFDIFFFSLPSESFSAIWNVSSTPLFYRQELTLYISLKNTQWDKHHINRKQTLCRKWLSSALCCVHLFL